MNIVDEIWLLSEKGHESMENGDFSGAENCFKNAAALAQQNSFYLDGPNSEIEDLIQSLMTLARNAHYLQLGNVNNLDENQTITIKIDKKKRKSKRKLKKQTYNLIDETKYQTKLKLGKFIESGTEFNWIPDALMNGIVTITGGSGSGKTECLKSMAMELINFGIPCTILDLHGDLDIGIETISLDYTGNYSINPLELTSKSKEDGGPTPQINKIMNQFSYAVKDKFSATQSSWLRLLLKIIYTNHGIKQDDPTTWDNKPPSFSCLLKLIQNADEFLLNSGNPEYQRLVELFTNSTKLAVENRLIPILEHPAFSGKNNIKVEEFIHKPMRILLKPLNTIDMQFLAADTLMRQIFSYLKSKGHLITKKLDSKFRMFILIDETKILTGYKGKLNDSYHILNRFATEARKFGLGLVLASQIIGHFGRDIRSNAATKIILRTMDLDEAKRCAKELKINMEDITSITKSGEGFLITSQIPDAQRIQLYPSTKHSISTVSYDQISSIN